MASEVAPLILVVDDDEDIRDPLAELLRTDGYRVVTAANGLQARHRIAQDQPALMILDLTLPILSSWEVAKAMENGPVQVPFIIFSGSEETELPANRLGFYRKPVNPRYLLEAIRKYCKRA